MMYMKQTRQSLQAFGNGRNNELEKVKKQTNQWKRMRLTYPGTIQGPACYSAPSYDVIYPVA